MAQMVRLVQMARRGDQDAIAQLYNRTYQQFFVICRQIVSGKRSSAETEDVLQDSYVKIFTSLDTLQDDTKFIPWAKRIVTNTALNAIRRDMPVLMEQEEAMDAVQAEPLRDAQVNNPERIYDRMETSSLVAEMVRDLPEEQRLCIYLFYVEEYTVRDIAAELNISENTVKSRLNYGRSKVKGKVLELEKSGIRLHGILPFPFFVWMLRQYMQDTAESTAVSASVRAGMLQSLAQSGALSSAAAGGTARAGSGAAKAAAKATKNAARGAKAAAAGAKTAVGGAKAAAAGAAGAAGKAVGIKVAAIAAAALVGVGGGAVGIKKLVDYIGKPHAEVSGEAGEQAASWGDGTYVEIPGISDDFDHSYIEKYRPVIEKYCTALTEQWDDYELEAAGLSATPSNFYHSTLLDQYGFEFMDLNRDHIPELVIGYWDSENMFGVGTYYGMVDQIYAFSEGEPKAMVTSHALPGYASYQSFILHDNGVIEDYYVCQDYTPANRIETIEFTSFHTIIASAEDNYRDWRIQLAKIPGEEEEDNRYYKLMRMHMWGFEGSEEISEKSYRGYEKKYSSAPFRLNGTSFQEYLETRDLEQHINRDTQMLADTIPITLDNDQINFPCTLGEMKEKGWALGGEDNLHLELTKGDFTLQIQLSGDDEDGDDRMLTSLDLKQTDAGNVLGVACGASGEEVKAALAEQGLEFRSYDNEMDANTSYIQVVLPGLETRGIIFAIFNSGENDFTGSIRCFDYN